MADRSTGLLAVTTAKAVGWTNWSGSVSARPEQIARPRSEDEIIGLVLEAGQQGQEVRVAGSGHSFVPLCRTEGTLICLDDMSGLRSINVDGGEATVLSGTKIHDIGPALRAAGMAMTTMGDIDRQAIAGAIATGTHGTGETFGSISTQVTKLRLIRADGEVVELSEATGGEALRAAQVSLGTLGVVTEVTLRVVPAFRLHERIWRLPFEGCVTQLDRWIPHNRHFEFFYYAHKDECEIKTLNTTERPPDDMAGIEDERIGHSDQIFPSDRNLKFNEIEFALPAERGEPAVRELRTLMREAYPDIRWPLEYRTLAADDIPLSPAFGRKSVTISAHQGAELPFREFFADCEAIFRRHGGRPHWGKIHSHTALELAALYPMWDSFHRLRQRYDPDGRFSNDYLRNLFGEAPEA